MPPAAIPTDPPAVAALAEVLLADPARVAAGLRDPRGPLAFAWPAVSGSLLSAPVWVVRAEAELGGRITWEGVLAWTAPANVDGFFLRLSAAGLGGRVEGLTLDGLPLASETDVFAVERPIKAGRTVAVRLAGTTIAGTGAAETNDRLLVGGGLASFASWLPLPTPCDDRGICDRTPWTQVSDPGSHEAMVFVAEVTTSAPTLLHPGAEWPVAPGRTGIAAIGVRELPLVLLDGWSAVEAPGTPLVRVWARDRTAATVVAERARDAAADFGARYGPLPHRRLDLVLSLPDPGSGVELPGLVLLSPISPWAGDVATCWVVAHEVAHQWWYGEVGSDALGEPWVDESLASWSAHDHCRRAGQPVELYQEAMELGLEGAPLRTADPAGALGEAGWGVVYARGISFFEALAGPDPDALDAALRHWLTEQRWQHATGAEQLRALEAELGRRRVDEAWEGWMNQRY